MRLFHLSRKGSNRVLVLVDNHIDDVGELCHVSGSKHVAVERVIPQNAGAGILAINKTAAMIAKHRHLITDARQNTLASSRKAGKEMRFNEALRHQQIGLGSQTVDDQRCAARKRSDLHIGVLVPAVMDNDLFM